MLVRIWNFALAWQQVFTRKVFTNEMSICRPALVFLFLSIAACGAQSFEVASIKPNAANDHRVSIRTQPGGRFTATGINTRLLMTEAFGIRDFQITNAPGWTNDDRYDVNAKAESSVDRISPEWLRPMLKALLEERFQLKYHQETRELPVYSLVVAKSGSKLTPSESKQPGPQMRMGRGQVNAKGANMAMIARMISQQMGRDVIDKTGLTSTYDINLEWTPEPGQGGGPGAGPGGPPPLGALPPADSTGPTLVTALQEQLGLRLESSKGPVMIIVVDSIAKPTEN